MKLVLTTAAVILAGLALTPRANAQLVNVDFSFQAATGGHGEGGPGLVTGELIGLQANGTSAPTDVIILSGSTTPLGPNPPAEPFPESVPFDFDAHNATQSGGEFTLVNGVVTATVGDFQITENSVDQVTLELNYGTGGGGPGSEGYNILAVTPTGSESYSFYVNNGYGFDGATYTEATAAPEPSSYALSLVGLGFLAMLTIRRRSKRLRPGRTTDSIN